MLDLKVVLTYQKIDKELFAIEREISSCDERKDYVRSRKFLEEAAVKLDLYESKAERMKTMVAELEKKYAELEKKLEDFSDLDELMKNGGDIAFYKKNALSISEELKKIKLEINTLNDSIRATSDEYFDFKKQVLDKQKTYAEAKEKYNNIKKSREEEVKKIKDKLDELAKDIPPEIIKKYEMKRKEKVFPVIGELKENRCPFCSMEPPLAAINKLSGGNTIECDNCHRILYKGN